MQKPESEEPFTLSVGFALMALGAACLPHAAVWFWLRQADVASDPYIGAEGLTFFAIGFIALGAILARRDHNARAKIARNTQGESHGNTVNRTV